jgi:hypothetical protein
MPRISISCRPAGIGGGRCATTLCTGIALSERNMRTLLNDVLRHTSVTQGSFRTMPQSAHGNWCMHLKGDVRDVVCAYLQTHVQADVGIDPFNANTWSW